MIFRLALALGMTVRQLLAQTDSRELTEWAAYEMVEPFGPWRDDLRSGIVASTVANALRGKNSQVLMPQDFIPEFEGPAAEMSVEQTIAAFGAAFGVNQS